MKKQDQATEKLAGVKYSKTQSNHMIYEHLLFMANGRIKQLEEINKELLEAARFVHKYMNSTQLGYEQLTDAIAKAEGYDEQTR